MTQAVSKKAASPLGTAVVPHISYDIKRATTPKYKANSARASHIAVWERDFNRSLKDDRG